jgi:hypothetical protein
MPRRPMSRVVSVVLLTGLWLYGEVPVANAQPASASTPQQAPQTPPLNPTQEVAGETATGPAIAFGPLQVRLGGYIGLTGIYRSTNSGGGVGTGFASTPYQDTIQGEVSEARLSAQASRLSLRVDADFPESSTGLSKLGGYFEMDFAGSTPGTVAVTSSSVGFRLRQAFAEAQHKKVFFLAAGQAFSLMTPLKDQLSIWPSDVEMGTAVDTNYLAGVVWTRSPQFRFTHRPSSRFNWAVAVENPEQQLGRALVTLPSCCTSDLEEQYNTGNNELGVPNLIPDFVGRVAFNPVKAFHVDVGGVLRVFRHHLMQFDQDFKSAGGGISINSRFNPAAATKLMLQWAHGPGLGRYLGGMVPDVTIRANGEIDPIDAGSWMTGIEQKVSRFLTLSGYYSGVSTEESFSLAEDGESYVGYGFPGSSNSNNRRIQEVTGVFAWEAWKLADRGSMQLNIQTSWLTREPWSRGTGPGSADAVLFFAQIRYNLP